MNFREEWPWVVFLGGVLGLVVGVWLGIDTVTVVGVALMLFGLSLLYRQAMARVERLENELKSSSWGDARDGE